MRYFLYLLIYFPMQLVVYLLTPLIAIPYEYRLGWSNNRHYQSVEPRLPIWLSWFDTPDNSLNGDSGWNRDGTKYWNRLCWLYRNSLYGFTWSVLGLLMPSEQAWQWRYYSDWIKLDFGWLVDMYERDPELYKIQPKAKFQFSIRPRIFSWMKNYINTKLLKNVG